MIIKVEANNDIFFENKLIEIVEASGADPMVKYFVDRNGKDIDVFFPGVEINHTAEEVAYVVCCNGNPAGLLMGTDLGNGAIDVKLDYSIPAYRDCSVGTYLYANLKDFGVKKLIFTQNKVDAHVSYLNKMGFENVDGDYVKNLV